MRSAPTEGTKFKKYQTHILTIS